MDVEVDLYSGRPNPRYRLNPATALELLRRLAGLAPAPTPATTPDQLGYRGLRVAPGELGAPITEIHLTAGLIRVRERGGREFCLLDPGRDLERWLATEAAPGLDPVVWQVIRNELH